MSKEQYPRPDWDTAQKIAELLLGLRKPGYDVYIDIVIPEGGEAEWEYTETPHE